MNNPASKQEPDLLIYLKEKYINLDLKGDTKKEIVEELVGLIFGLGKQKDKKALINEILKREKLGSTGIGNGVAIPHAKSDKMKNFILAFARKREGIDYGALDGEKTYLFFLLASPESNVGGHLKILSGISRLVKDKFIVDRLKKAADKKEIIKIFSVF
ncbi:MAG: PTS sugar transporter subunit IIA [Candidatus Omnitrophota bacterium]|nr:PTS sugar transporter subunit IIA [Candidatus Omnitrophota bacterium]MBU1929302.1 PTS sugar transporter subunit IIA [Candidatus Omnitrophota bacterium]MBU2035594.1 PTS sugar transporter subunit IIA [Candidatus Omnitrophota bacterium]MBU2258017.1 PTS sugar transporter subunit IIA [Candidatus Omnitrophota bacterium]